MPAGTPQSEGKLGTGLIYLSWYGGQLEKGELGCYFCKITFAFLVVAFATQIKTETNQNDSSQN